MPLPAAHAEGHARGWGSPVSYDLATRNVMPGSGPQGPFRMRGAATPGQLPLAAADTAAANAGADFSALSVVPNPDAAPWNAHVKLFLTFPSDNSYVCSGTLIDPRHVLTAGHCVHLIEEGGWAESMTAVPAYDHGAQPFGNATSTSLHSFTGWTEDEDFDHDIGLVALDRPLGALASWHGYGYHDDPSFFTGNTFLNPGYPAAPPYDGQQMYSWSGDFDYTEYSSGWYGQEVGIHREAYGGQSGSGASTTNAGNQRIVYAVLSNGTSSRTNFPRLTADKFNHIQGSIIADHTPSSADLVPLNVQASPAVAAGGQLSSLSYVVHNYSSVTFEGTVSVDVYLSSNDNITTFDTLLQTRSFTGTLGPKSTLSITATDSLPEIPADVAGGNYWIGVILDIDDADASNNDTDGQDASPISLDAVTQPDLEPHRPSGWDDTLVIATESGTSVSSHVIYDDDDLYVDYAVINSGSADAAAFRYGLYLDGTLRKFVERSSMSANTFGQVLDSFFEPLPAGTHTLEVRADYNDDVSEADELNNSYSRSFEITARNATGTIEGTKWNDLDGDAARDPTEPGLAGWTIFLDDNQNGHLDPDEPWTVTDANGTYEFTDLQPATYTVAEAQQPGWVQTFPAPANGAAGADAGGRVAARSAHHPDAAAVAPAPRVPEAFSAAWPEPSSAAGGHAVHFDPDVDDNLLFPLGWLGPLADSVPRSHSNDPLTVILDFNDPGQPATTDGLGNVVGDFDVTDYGFSAGQFDTVTAAVLDLVATHYHDIADADEFADSPLASGEQLAIEFEIGDIGTPPANGSDDYYYLQIGDGLSGPCMGALGCASTNSIRNQQGSAGAPAGSVVGSIFSDVIATLQVSPADALTSGNLALTAHAVGGTTSHEIGHAVSLAHLDKAESVTPRNLPPLMGTGAIDLPNQDRISLREFAYSGFNEEADGAQQFHLDQLVAALGVHQAGGHPDPEPADGVWTVAVQAGGTVTGIDFGNRSLGANEYIVNTTDDTPDTDAGDGICADAAGNCSLRAAIDEANAQTNATGPDVIRFQLPGNEVHLIAPQSALPMVTDPVIIDGTTQPGYTGSPRIELDGSAAGDGAAGLTIAAGDSTIAGLAIYQFGGSGIVLQGGAGNTIRQNHLGTDSAGTNPLGNGAHGVTVFASAHNVIGGMATSDGNLVSGNGVHGIFVTRSASTDNRVQNNIIGLAVDGVAQMGNGGAGIRVDQGANHNTIGSPGNTISANGVDGIRIAGVTSTVNLVAGNRIGTDVAGRLPRGNTANGVVVDNAPHNKIGVPGEGNLISGNQQNGVSINGSDATSNDVQANRIGLNVDGSEPLPNQLAGVSLFDAAANMIGGTTAGAGNTISGNRGTGVFITGASAANNRLAGNLIGTTPSGTAPLGNQSFGVVIRDAPDNTVGGNEAGGRNVISGNGAHGVGLIGNSATGNVVAGNLIGTNLAGTGAIGNGQAGVLVFRAPANRVGGEATWERNIISGNGLFGVRLTTFESDGNEILGNFIGTDVTGSAALPNGDTGLHLANARNTTIGGSTASARNVISGNANHGVVLVGSGVAGNRLLGNYIGISADGATRLGNTHVGVLIQGGASNNQIGGPLAGQGNVISGNGSIGIGLLSANTTGNSILGNLVGTDSTGMEVLGNQSSGIVIVAAAETTIGGTTAGARNVISGNGVFGISIAGASATGTQVQGNYIGTNARGDTDLGNHSSGIFVSAPGNLIGGVTSGAGNVISGNDFVGIRLSGFDATGNQILGNLIGTRADGTTPLGNHGNGIRIDDASGNMVGGVADGAGNVIAYQTSHAIAVVGSALANTIRGNSMYFNAGLGIDLNLDGPTPNDVIGGMEDSDEGPNLLQNVPNLTAANLSGRLRIAYHVPSSVEFSAYPLTIDFYLSDLGGAAGEVYLGSDTYLASDATNSKLAELAAGSLIAGDQLVATATDANGNTSEFSAPLSVTREVFPAGEGEAGRQPHLAYDTALCELQDAIHEILTGAILDDLAAAASLHP